MTKKKQTTYKLLTIALLGVLMLGMVVWYLARTNIPVLEPKGVVGQKERGLMLLAGFFAVFVVLPVFAMTALIVWKYRASNTKAKYSPEFAHSRVAESIWWLIPGVIILFLSVVTWRSSHELDPFKPLNTSAKPMTIQVVALDWKWLFVYPKEHIASVNFVQFPAHTPVTFQITADAPMNSFWIPQLGGQIYAMPGMSTALHLMADTQGSYAGSSANISGEGFAGMRFTAKASSEGDFNAWVHAAQNSSNRLNFSSYEALAQPSKDNPSAYYTLDDNNLYNQIVEKYMTPMPGMDMTGMHNAEVQ